MLKLDGRHKITSFGTTKAGKPYIFVFVKNYERNLVNGDKMREWISAKVFFDMCNVNIKEIEEKKVNYAELGPHFLMSLDSYLNDKTQEMNHVINVKSDYIRCFFWDNEAKQEYAKNDKIETTQSKQHNDIADEIMEDLNQEVEYDWDEDI